MGKWPNGQMRGGPCGLGTGDWQRRGLRPKGWGGSGERGSRDREEATPPGLSAQTRNPCASGPRVSSVCLPLCSVCLPFCRKPPPLCGRATGLPAAADHWRPGGVSGHTSAPSLRHPPHSRRRRVMGRPKVRASTPMDCDPWALLREVAWSCGSPEAFTFSLSFTLEGRALGNGQSAMAESAVANPTRHGPFRRLVASMPQCLRCHARAG
jgi:hypothetical protein